MKESGERDRMPDAKRSLDENAMGPRKEKVRMSDAKMRLNASR